MELDSMERDEKVKEMKNKWRHVRDNYYKFMNQGKSGDAAPNKKKKYIYADSLTFLQITMKKRNTSGNIPKNLGAEENEEDEEGVNTEDSQEPDEVEDAAGVANEIRRPKATSIRERQRRVHNLTPFQNQLLKRLDNSCSKHIEDDADKSFLMSLLPDYKQLNAEEKLDFKFMTLQFFRDLQQMKNNSTPLASMNATYQFSKHFLDHSQYHLPPQVAQTFNQSTHTQPRPSFVHTPLISPQNSQQSSESCMSHRSMYEL
ncbi:uncharacterized protein LOC116168905 [Photinus pyralis]|nr:uncharacterized protein LOC116168905 [Photinus pyralis]